MNYATKIILQERKREREREKREDWCRERRTDDADDDDDKKEARLTCFLAPLPTAQTHPRCKYAATLNIDANHHPHQVKLKTFTFNKYR